MSPSDWDRRERDFEQRPWWMSLKIGLCLLALVFVLALVGGLLSGVLDWGGEAKRITGPANAREQYTEIIRDQADMDAAVGNICSARGAKTAAPTADDPLLVETPALAYEATYRRTKADYDRRIQNAFEAGLIRKYTSLGDQRRFPNPAPTLEDRLATDCPT